MLNNNKILDAQVKFDCKRNYFELKKNIIIRIYIVYNISNYV